MILDSGQWIIDTASTPTYNGFFTETHQKSSKNLDCNSDTGNQFLVEDGVILVTGGDNSVEALNSNGTHLCKMPDLPDTRY